MELGLKDLLWWEINADRLLEPREAFTELISIPGRRSYFECRKQIVWHGEMRYCRERYFDLTPPVLTVEGKWVRVVWCNNCGFELRPVGLDYDKDLIALGRRTL